MAYRDDTEHLRRRLRAVRDELNTVRKKTEELEALALQQRSLEDEALELERGLQIHERRRAVPVLDNLAIASPCEATWSEMVGDDRRRLCGHCNRYVYDLAAMTRDEIHALVGAPGSAPCVRLYQRADGTLMTADCPIGARRRRWVAFSALAFGTLTGAVLLFAGHRPRPPMPSVPPEPPAPVPAWTGASIEVVPYQPPEPCSAAPPDRPPHRIRMGKVKMKL
jgi:hypothetical protein